tara:strand:+ start:279 stop:989 length:711 start_codon:yes stop_codon:yes gene_type:complete
LEEDISEKLWSVLGTAVHKVFEDHSGEDVISEERLFVEVDGWVISGAIDLQDADGPSDYKCTSVWAVIHDKVEWEYQLNAYAWLMRHAKGVHSKKLSIIAVMRDWNRRQAEASPDYPQAPIATLDISMWSDEKQDAFMDHRIELHKDAEFRNLVDDRLPDCTDEERWTKPSTYAVKKGTNKRAVRVLDSLEDAESYIKDNELDNKHHVEHRLGEYTRCAGNWCRVADFCDQWQEQQ